MHVPSPVESKSISIYVDHIVTCGCRCGQYVTCDILVVRRRYCTVPLVYSRRNHPSPCLRASGRPWPREAECLHPGKRNCRRRKRRWPPSLPSTQNGGLRPALHSCAHLRRRGYRDVFDERGLARWPRRRWPRRRRPSRRRPRAGSNLPAHTVMCPAPVSILCEGAARIRLGHAELQVRRRGGHALATCTGNAPSVC